MSDTTTIEWTDSTWNPITGCTKVTPGCDNCYAETFAERWRGTPGHYFENGFDLTLRPNALIMPLRWRKPRRVFVNSMSDLFHKDIPDEYIARVFAVMALTPQHTYQVLTKRHGRMRALVAGPHRVDMERGYTPGVWFRSLVQNAAREFGPEVDLFSSGSRWPLRNVWLGVSVEDQKRADLRIPTLLETPAAVRFLSCEPLLGPVDIEGSLRDDVYRCRCGVWERDGSIHKQCAECGAAWAQQPGSRIDWAIVGGESGPGARPMSPDWARSLRDQCQAANVPYLFKQWGAFQPTGYMAIGARAKGCEFVGDPIDDLGHRWEMRRVGKKAAGRELDGRTWDEFPATAGAAA